ncbi:hypothetical protein LSH36_544g03002 [Paralvinella palmiformis]|uniref:Uncharacterized protein n=1 Tax=Paralvinella palmiformis TaxID=53620 RepID=A0AAD9J826_9ANNE|nr:hypothetical protein LSH36_544g03002 [Paralvinella palmiformis]
MDDVIEESGRFIAACYGSHERTNMSAIRYDIWTSKMANKKLTAVPQLKTLPPTTEVFGEHVHRAHSRVVIWRKLFSKIRLILILVILDGHCMKDRNHLTPTHFLLIPAAPDVLQLINLIKCGCA